MATAPAGYAELESGLLVPDAVAASAVSDVQHPTAWLVEWAQGRQTVAGMPVSPHSSMGLTTYWACVRAIAEDLGKLPLIVYKRLPRGKERAPEHPLYDVLHHAFNDEMTAMAAKEAITHHAVAWGTGYGAIERNQTGQPLEIYPIHPTRVRVCRDEATKGIVYEVYGGESWSQADYAGRIPAADMIHIHGLGSDGLRGYSPCAMAAETLGLSLAAQRYGAAFFGNSGRPSGILKHPGKLGPEGKKNLSETWKELHGGPNRSQGVAVLTEGMEFQAIDLPPEQAQFLATRQFQVLEICRLFRMPPHKVADLRDAHYNNVEQQNIDYVTDTLMPWAVRWEQELKRKLFWGTEFFAEYLFTALLRGDQAARSTYYKTLLNVGALSPNDIRELENMTPYDGGDQYFMQLNMGTVDQISSGEALRQPRHGQPAPDQERGTDGP